MQRKPCRWPDPPENSSPGPTQGLNLKSTIHHQNLSPYDAQNMRPPYPPTCGFCTLNTCSPPDCPHRSHLAPQANRAVHVYYNLGKQPLMPNSWAGRAPRKYHPGLVVRDHGAMKTSIKRGSIFHSIWSFNVIDFPSRAE